MTRQQELNNFLSEIKDKKIFCDFWKKMEDFLQHDNDDYTKELQKAISVELQENFDTYVSFEDFLADYADNHPQDSANYNSLRSKIYGKI